MPHSKDIGFQLHNLSNLLRQRAEASTSLLQSDDHISRNNLWIINYLAHHSKQDVFQKDIENAFCVRRSTVSKVIRLMEEKGYIRREVVTKDARLKKLVLTESGWAVHQLMLKEHQSSEELLRQGITDDELEVFFHVMQKLKNNILTH